MQDEDGAASPIRVGVLSVTYSDRVAFLDAMIKSCIEQGARDFIVFLNNIAPAAREKLVALETWAGQQPGVTLILMNSDRNIGSAAAYAQGITLARSRFGALDAVLLMDDDNMLAQGCLTHLAAAAAARPGSAIASVRSARAYMTQAARTGRVDAALAGEAYGLDIRKRPLRLLRRLFGCSKAPSSSSGQRLISMSRGPFGGLMIPVSLMQNVDPPRADFIIYAEDYEYSERLSAQGGLFLALDATVHDQEESWNVAGPRRSNIGLLATAKPDFRLYYGLRNAIFLDRRRANGWRRMLLLFHIGLLVTSGCLRAAMHGKFSNIPVICRAVIDGFSGRLGANPAFPASLIAIICTVCGHYSCVNLSD
jgi:GT2 family glycosyltransferase